MCTEKTVTKDFVRRVYLGENLLEEVLDLLLEAQDKENLKKALEANIPITIFDDCDGGDGLLYKALKNAGAPCVRSYQIDKENGLMETNCAYYAVFLNRKLEER